MEDEYFDEHAGASKDSQNWIIDETEQFVEDFKAKGWETCVRVQKNIREAYKYGHFETARDYLAVFRIGKLFLKLSCDIFFEQYRKSPTPHDLLINYKNQYCIIEVKRFREEKLGGQQFKSEKLVEIPREKPILQTAIQALRNKKSQLELDIPNIVWFVSSNIFFNAENIQDVHWFEMAGHKMRPDSDDFYKPIDSLTGVGWLHDYSNTTAVPKAFFFVENLLVKELLEKAGVILPKKAL